MRIDNVFVFLSPRSSVPERLAAIGLSESCRNRLDLFGIEERRYCFANMHLSLIEVFDDETFNGPLPQAVSLPQRAQWRQLRSSPFGVGVYLDADEADLPFRTLAQGEDASQESNQPVPVALASIDARQPFLFCAPGCFCPRLPTGDRHDHFGTEGFGAVRNVHFCYPRHIPPAAEFHLLASRGLISLGMTSTTPNMVLTIDRSGMPPLKLELPEGIALS